MALDERWHIVTSIRWRIAAPNESEGERPQPRRRGRVGAGRERDTYWRQAYRPCQSPAHERDPIDYRHWR